MICLSQQVGELGLVFCKRFEQRGSVNHKLDDNCCFVVDSRKEKSLRAVMISAVACHVTCTYIHYHNFA